VRDEVEVAVPTLFRPVTLEPLLDALREQGVTAIRVIEGQPVNDAWRQAIREATRRYLFILNDDIEIGRRFVSEMLYAHGLGGTFVYGSRVPAFTGRSREIRSGMVRGVHLGEAFSLDLSVVVPPIPDDFRIYHGDDWLYFQHDRHGRCVEALGAEYKTEESFSAKHPDIGKRMQEFFGCTLDEVARREHLASRRYFVIPNGLRHVMDMAGVDYRAAPTDVRRAFMGSAAGLLH
jgi:hypothetical protein